MKYGMAFNGSNLFFHSPGLKPSPFRRKALAEESMCYNRSWEGNHCSGSVAFFGAFKKNPSVCSGSAIPSNPTGISHCQTFMYLIDIKGLCGLESLTNIADSTTHPVSISWTSGGYLGWNHLLNAY